MYFNNTRVYILYYCADETDGPTRVDSIEYNSVFPNACAATQLKVFNK